MKIISKNFGFSLENRIADDYIVGIKKIIMIWKILRENSIFILEENNKPKEQKNKILKNNYIKTF